MTAIRIHDVAEEWDYMAHKASDCIDDTDRSAFELAVQLGQTVTVGKVVAQPWPPSDYDPEPEEWQDDAYRGD